MKVVAFTCLVGSTPDTLRPPAFISPSVRYVCLTDRKSSPFPYKHVPVEVPPGKAAAQLYARKLKILANHPALGEADVVLWHDAAFQLIVDPAMVARHAFSGQPDRVMVALSHPYRTRIEEEAAEIARLGYADRVRLTAQVASYRAEGWTQQVAITSTGYVMRRRTEAVAQFNRTWWAEVARWCWRDQMSVDYALWKTGLACHYIEGHYRDNPFARWFKSPATTRLLMRPERSAWPYPRSPGKPA